MKPLDPRLLRYARATQVHIAVCVVLGAVTAGLVLAQAELLSRGIAGVVADGRALPALSAVMIGVAAVVAGRVAVAWLLDSASQRSAAKVKSQLRHRLIAHAAALGPRADTEGRAEIATLTTRGVDALDNYFGRYLPQLALSAIVPVVILARLVPADLTSAFIVALTLPLIPVFMILVGMTTAASNAKRWNALQRLSHHFVDVVAGLTTLKVFGRAKAQADAVRRSTDRYRTETMATLRLAFLSSLVLELVATLSVALVAVSIGLRLVDGRLDLRTGLLVIILAPEAYLPLRQVGAQYHAAAEGVAAADHVFAILETPLAKDAGRAPAPNVDGDWGIRVDRVSVAHPGRRGYAPADVSLHIARGELVVVTGQSGSGKSTLLAVLLGAIEPDCGEVTVCTGGDRVALSSIDVDSWHRQLVWVDQTPYLFAGTVADNVRLSLPDARDGQVRDALDAAGLQGMALTRRLEERGRGLSAGEQRRVALARAVLRGAPLVLLDEPTAGLDEITEAEVLQTVRAMAQTAAVIMASHRPAAIAVADRVVTIRASTADSTSGAAPKGQRSLAVPR